MEVCVANIGPQQRRRRLMHGVLTFAACVPLAVVLAGSTVWLRALLFLPLLGAAIGVFQYLEKT